MFLPQILDSNLCCTGKVHFSLQMMSAMETLKNTRINLRSFSVDFFHFESVSDSRIVTCCSWQFSVLVSVFRWLFGFLRTRLFIYILLFRTICCLFFCRLVFFLLLSVLLSFFFLLLLQFSLSFLFLFCFLLFLLSFLFFLLLSVFIFLLLFYLTLVSSFVLLLLSSFSLLLVSSSCLLSSFCLLQPSSCLHHLSCP